MRSHRRLGSGAGPRAGIPRANGRAIIDDAGEWLPLGITHMWSLQGALNEPERYLENLEWEVANGFDFKRPLYEVAWTPPLTINPGPATPTLPAFPDHLGAVARDLDLCWELGLRSGITLSGKGTGYDYPRLARDVGAVIADGREHKVILVEMQNEYSNGGDPLEVLEAMASAIAPLIRNLIGLSTPGAGGETEADAIKAAARRLALAIMIRHTERNAGDYGWRDVRQAWDFHLDGGFVGADWEGPGPGSSGSTNTNPLQLAMKRAVAAMCGAPIFVLHTGTGVYGDGKPSSSGAPRPPNFWEIANIDRIVSAVRGIAALLPPGLPNWRQANTQWVPPNPVAPFQPHNHWEGEHGDGVNKAYAALADDGRVIQMPCGVRGHVRLTASYPLADVAVYHPIALETVATFPTLEQGQAIDLPGGGLEADVAYVIHGRRR